MHYCARFVNFKELMNEVDKFERYLNKIKTDEKYSWISVSVEEVVGKRDRKAKLEWMYIRSI